MSIEGHNTSMTTFARLEIVGSQTEINVRDTDIELMFGLMLSNGEGAEVTAASPSRFVVSLINITPDALVRRVRERLLSDRDDSDEAWNQWAYICAEAIASGSSEIHIDVPQATKPFSPYQDMPGFIGVSLPEVFEHKDFEAKGLTVSHTEDVEACVVQEGEVISVVHQDVLFSFDEDSPIADYPLGTILKQITWCLGLYRDGLLESVVTTHNFATVERIKRG